MRFVPEGRAIVYCEGAFGTPNGKTAHGLVRRTRRYRVLSVVDSRHAGRDAGEVLDGAPCGIPVWDGLEQAIAKAHETTGAATHFVVGIAPDGGRLDDAARETVKLAIRHGLHVDCGLHDFLGDDPEIAALAARHQVRIRDVRKPPPRDELHFFSGKIADVESFRVALLGTDSAVGKRTTAWILTEALQAAGHTAEMIGTGQTAWMQGVRYGIILDSLVNDFVSGEIEHVVWRCWKEAAPEFMVLEGQGSLMNPAYPGGMELLAAGRPHVVVVQHAPARTHYDGFPGHPLHPLELQIRAIELLSERKVVAVTINHENLTPTQAREACRSIREATGLPTVDVLLDGAGELVEALVPLLPGGGS
jgi:uncharacterized NAD-dependent epimerase/dehydratase family protein